MAWPGTALQQHPRLPFHCLTSTCLGCVLLTSPFCGCYTALHLCCLSPTSLPHATNLCLQPPTVWPSPAYHCATPTTLFGVIYATMDGLALFAAENAGVAYRQGLLSLPCDGGSTGGDAVHSTKHTTAPLPQKYHCRQGEHAALPCRDTSTPSFSGGTSSRPQHTLLPFACSVGILCHRRAGAAKRLTPGYY